MNGLPLVPVACVADPSRLTRRTRVAGLVAGLALSVALTGGLAFAPRAASAQTATAAASATVPLSAVPASRVGTDLAELVARTEAALRGDPNEVRRLSDAALAQLAAQPDADLELRVRLVRCDYFNERDIAAARTEIERMRALLPRLRQPGLRAGILGCEGEQQENAGDNVQAMALYQQAVAVAEAAHDNEHLANALYLRGYLRGVLGEFVPGLADLKRSLALFERLKMPAHARTSVNGVAILYNRVGDYEQALHYFKDTLDAQAGIAMARERSVTLHNLGRAYEHLQRWDEAQHSFEQELALARELNYERGQVYALRGLASVRNAQGDARHALALVAQGVRLFGSVPDERLRAQLQLQRGIALGQLHRLPEATAALRDAVAVFRQGDAGAEEALARDALARTLAEQGDWQPAFEQQAQARKLTETLLQRQLDQRFASLKVQFDSELKDRENALLQRANRASEVALAEQRRVSQLQIVAGVLALALALALGVLALRQRHTTRRLRDLAMTDELTGLPNRRQALRELQRVLERPQLIGALLIADIDHFKPINDQHGHLVGDEILRAIAAAWRPLAAPGVQLGRLGGEEFLAVAEACTTEQALALGERLRSAISGLDVSRWLPGRNITVSVGVTRVAGGQTLGDVLGRADVALYRAKSGGRDRVELA